MILGKKIYIILLNSMHILNCLFVKFKKSYGVIKLPLKYQYLFNMKAIFFLLIFVILSSIFYNNIFHTVSKDRFHNADQWSNVVLISSQIYYLEHEKTFSLPLISSSLPISTLLGNMKYNFTKHDFMDFYHLNNKEYFNSMYSYYSHFGLQYYFLKPIWILNNVMYGDKINNISYWNSFKMSELFFSILAALMICSILLIFSSYYGIIVPLVVVSGIVYANPIFISFARNLYWATFSWFVPFLGTLLYFYWRPLNITYKHHSLYLLLISFFTILFKTLIGYEYISVFLMVTVSPVFYYAIVYKWKIKYWLKNCILLSTGALLGCVIAFFLHMNTSSSMDRMMKQELFILKFSDVVDCSLFYNAIQANKDMGKWVYEGVNIREYSQCITLKILSNDLFAYQDGKTFVVLFMTMLLFFGLAVKYSKNKLFHRHLLALIILSSINSIACFSWFFLSRAHSLIHSFHVSALYIIPNISILIFFGVYVSYIIHKHKYFEKFKE